MYSGRHVCYGSSFVDQPAAFKNKFVRCGAYHCKNKFVRCGGKSFFCFLRQPTDTYVNKYLNALLNCFVKRANEQPAKVTGKRNSKAKKGYSLLAHIEDCCLRPKHFCDSFLPGSVSCTTLFISPVLFLVRTYAAKANKEMYNKQLKKKGSLSSFFISFVCCFRFVCRELNTGGDHQLFICCFPFFFLFFYKRRNDRRRWNSFLLASLFYSPLFASLSRFFLFSSGMATPFFLQSSVSVCTFIFILTFCFVFMLQQLVRLLW